MAGVLSAEGLHDQMDFITMAADGTISYDGRSTPYGSAEAGFAVAITGNMQVGLATANEPYGVLIRVEPDKTAVVGHGGIQEFKIGGTPPTAGSKVVAGAGGIVVDAVAPAGVGRVVDVDTARGIAWVDLDAQ